MELSRRLLHWAECEVHVIGISVSWLTLAMVLVTFTVVVLRYGFNLGWIAAQESVTYLHATVFMLAAAWALQTDGHVRVDIFYRDASPKHRAIIDLAGTVLFLLPFCVFMLVISWEYVASSWKLLEGSREARGIHGVYLLKSLLLLMPALLLQQGLCNVARCVHTLRGLGRS
jgi:TRAP-type mannitol/chloroaromatic compound transport system permease small subunit